METRIDDRTERIRALNDRLRTTGQGGQTMMTRAVASLAEDELARVLAAVREFKEFSPDNDPWGEHDCASLEVDGRRILFKIDYYGPSLEFGSEDPADSARTRRVLTIMLAEDY
jgi:hypothetical protein